MNIAEATLSLWFPCDSFFFNLFTSEACKGTLIGWDTHTLTILKKERKKLACHYIFMYCISLWFFCLKYLSHPHHTYQPHNESLKVVKKSITDNILKSSNSI